MNIFERIKRLNLPAGEYAVFGSALLEVWGLRTANDLDIIVTPDLFDKLKKGRWKQHQGHGFPYLSKLDANVTTLQDQPTDGDYNPNRLELITGAVMIRELPFVRIEEVIACKKSYAREKDFRDIGMIEEYLKSHPDPYLQT